MCGTETWFWTFETFAHAQMVVAEANRCWTFEGRRRATCTQVHEHFPSRKIREGSEKLDRVGCVRDGILQLQLQARFCRQLHLQQLQSSCV